MNEVEVYTLFILLALYDFCSFFSSFTEDISAHFRVFIGYLVSSCLLFASSDV